MCGHFRGLRLAMDLIHDLIQSLEQTQGDTRAQSALSAEFLLMAHWKEKYELQRPAMDAAAVLRWFDANLLARVLDISNADAQARFEALRALPVIESRSARGPASYNVQQLTRLGWRNRLAIGNPVRFRTLSANAAGCFANDVTYPGRIEWIYHLLCADPERGATALQELVDWNYQSQYEDRSALIAGLQEIEESNFVRGRARAWTLLAIAWARVARDETAELADLGKLALSVALASEDQRAIVLSHSLLGEVLQSQGNLAKALVSFRAALKVGRRVAV